MIKLIISDMDGTLLNSHLSISLDNQHAINSAVKNGFHFAIATGRHISEARPILTKSNISCPLITGNGSAIYDAQGNLQDVFALTQERTLDILEKAKQFPNLHVEVTTVDDVLCDNLQRRDDTLRSFIRLHHPTVTDTEMTSILEKQKTDLPVTYVPSLYDMVKESKPNTLLKLLIVNTTEDDSIHQLRQQLESLNDIAISSSYANNIEINAASATKGKAVTQLASTLNISLENVMAIGDNLNDVSMLSIVGMGVAMGNAHETVKNIARDITDTADNSGVAKAIFKHTSLNR